MQSLPKANLDIVIPVYNEKENIRSTLDALNREVKTPSNILICYDQEEDTTLPVVKSYPSRHPIYFVKNKGSGVHSAVLTGFQAGQSDAVLVYPADDDYNAGVLDEMYQKFTEGNDIVAASRFMRGGSMKGCPLIKSFLVRSASFTLHHFALIPIQDASNGFRLFSRRLLNKVSIQSTHGFAYSIELLVKAHRLGLKIVQVPARWFERAHGQSRFMVGKWLPHYLKWYFFAFATTYFRRTSL